MEIISCLSTAVFTKEWVVAQLLKPSSNQETQELLPSAPEMTEPIVSVHQIEERSVGEQLTTQQNELHKRIEAIETRISSLEAQQFSPTALLEGEVILGVTGASGEEIDDSTVLQGGVELILNASFTGEDILQVGIESGNSQELSFVGETTFEGRLDSPSDTDSDRFELSELNYAFPIGDRASLYISTTGDDINEFNPFLEDDAISEFGIENPINNLLEDFGLQLDYELTDEIVISLGYFSDDASNPQAEAGLFDGNFSAFAQLEFEPSDRFLLGLTYIHTYNDSSLETETGSLRSQLDLERPVRGNSYAIAASFAPSSRLAIGGWVGFTKATVIDLGDADVWNYALTLALPDFGREDSLFGIVIGQEPRLMGTSGFEIDDRTSDPDTSLHIEVFYRTLLSDQISVTPGLVWITAPNHDSSNPDILVFTLRTKFEF